MEFTARPLIAAGVTALGLGLVTASPPAVTPSSVAMPAVQLTSADSGLISVWAQVADRSLTNITNLGTAALNPPLPILQQVVTNQVMFLEEFLHNPASIVNIVEQTWDNLKAAVNAPFVQPQLSNLDPLQTLAYHALSGLMTDIVPDNPELGQKLLDFSTTSLSGWIIGELGTVISPLVELNNSVGDIADAVRDGNWQAAITDLFEVPAHMLDGFLNGAGPIDIYPLVENLDIPVITIRALELELPGLLNGGGTIFGSIDADVCGATLPIVGCVLPIVLTGTESGPLGSMIDIGHEIAQALGWDGTGNPIDALIAAI